MEKHRNDRAGGIGGTGSSLALPSFQQDDGSNALILPSSSGTKGNYSATKKENTFHSAGDVPKKKSKALQRKLQKIKEEKEKRERRMSVFKTLEQHKLSDDTLGLLQPSGTRGQTETMKVMLRRALQFERAGLAVPEEIPLLRKRKSLGNGCDDDDDDDRSGNEMEDNGDGGAEIGSGRDGDKNGDGLWKKARSRNVDKTMVANGLASDVSGKLKVEVGDKSDIAEKSQYENKKRDEVDAVDGGGVKKNQKRKKKKKKRKEGQDERHEDESERKNSGGDGLSNGIKDLTVGVVEGEKVIPSALLNGGAKGDKKDNEEVHVVKPGRKEGGKDAKNAGDAPGTADINGEKAVGNTLPARNTKAFVVEVKRKDGVQTGRSKLPIIGMEQEIMEAVTENPVSVICGETGCGKTTQVPQFLYEAGYGSPMCDAHPGAIGVTQPRRVAAVTTAKRVAHELNVPLGKVVGFQVRYDRQAGEGAAIKFMTDGILLREVQTDFLLRKYSVIVIDEAHERSLNTDILIGLLSRIVPLRQGLYEEQARLAQKIKSSSSSSPGIAGSKPITPLKLVIMSATLRVEDFIENIRLFPKPPPVVKVAARQYPVTVHFSKRTELVDYAGVAYKKVCQIHRRLPPGGVLVFVTGQREVEWLCRKLRRTFEKRWARRTAAVEDGRREGEPEIMSDEHAQGKSPSDVDGAQEDDVEKEIWKAVDGDGGYDRVRGNVQNVRGGRSWDAYGQDGVEVEAEGSDGGDDDEEEDEDEGEDEDDVSDEERERSQSWKFFDQGEDEKEKNSSTVSLNHEQKVDGPPESGKEFLSGVSGVEGGLAKLDNREKGRGGAPSQKVLVLPLYAMLPAKAQLKVFAPPPDGVRLIVVATNVAETSVTIPGIRYVVDCGRAKEREYDRASGVSSFEVRWISKASADQRAGRAGRTGPGHCYRLYSSAVFSNLFEQHRLAEIHRSPIEGVVLQMKAMGIDKVVNFPFPTPPDQAMLLSTEKSLVVLSALSAGTGVLTPIGKEMAVYPISPRHSRMLVAALTALRQRPLDNGKSRPGSRSRSQTLQQGKVCLAYVLAIAAGLSLDSPFLWGLDGDGDDGKKSVAKGGPCVSNNADEVDGAGLGEDGKMADQEQMQGEEEDWMVKQEKEKRRGMRKVAAQAHARFKNSTSDVITLVNALREYERAGNKEEFCATNFLHAKTMHEMAMLRKQLVRIAVRQWGSVGDAAAVRMELCEEDLELDDTLDMKGEEVVGRAVCAGWADRVARRFYAGKHGKGDLPTTVGGEEMKRTRAVRYQACSLSETTYLHPSSATAKEAPDWVVYGDIVTTSRPYMRGVTAVNSKWLASEAAGMCTFSKALDDPPPWYAADEDQIKCWVVPTFGPHLWQLPLHAVELKGGREKVVVFAKALLEGKVFPSMRELAGGLAADPGMIARKEGAGHVRVGELLARLDPGGRKKGAAAERVDSKSKLLARLDSEPTFLLRELALWVREGERGTLERVWRSIGQTAKAHKATAGDKVKEEAAVAGKGNARQRPPQVGKAGTYKAGTDKEGTNKEGTNKAGVVDELIQEERRDRGTRCVATEKRGVGASKRKFVCVKHGGGTFAKQMMMNGMRRKRYDRVKREERRRKELSS